MSLQVPVFAVTPKESAIKFSVKASVPIEGHFDKWDASLTFGSTDVTSGDLEITIQAATVNTGSGMKDNKLRSKDFFDVKENPLITFKSTKRWYRQARPPLTSRVPLRYAVSLNPRR